MARDNRSFSLSENFVLVEKYRVAIKVSYCTLSICSLNIDQFSHFLPVDSVRNLLLRGMHTTLIMSLNYLVKYKYPKIYNICR